MLLPFSTVIVVRLGGSAFCFSFSPSATAVAFEDDWTPWCANVWMARWTFSELLLPA